MPLGCDRGTTLSWRCVGSCGHPVLPVPPSTLLQNLESCANDPVAVAVCFVTRVRASKVGGTGSPVGTPGGTHGHTRLSLCSPYPQSQEFAIYTQYCNNYPRWVGDTVG